MRGEKRVVFAVPAGAGDYAPETLECRQAPDTIFDFVAVLTLAIESLPAGAQAEIDVLKAGVNKSKPAAADWITNVAQATSTGLYNPLLTAGWRGVRIRVRSDGAAGDAPVNATWSDEDQ